MSAATPLPSAFAASGSLDEPSSISPFCILHSMPSLMLYSWHVKSPYNTQIFDVISTLWSGLLWPPNDTEMLIRLSLALLTTFVFCVRGPVDLFMAISMVACPFPFFSTLLPWLWHKHCDSFLIFFVFRIFSS
jgi:hypothetical protein